MRRRPRRLQVTTFPFLAVLLCAMGSLIFLLLVIDRRAKAVARHKAQQAAQQARADKTRKSEGHKQEWERQRRAIHDLLAEQRDALRQELRQAGDRVQLSQGNLAKEAAELQAYDQKLVQARAFLAQESAALAARQSSLSQEKQKDGAARQEMERLATELADLQVTLAALRELRRRGQQTYSLVPFQGKRGVSRRPIYVECTARGLIFHPDGEGLTGIRLGPTDIRQAVEARLKRLPPPAPGDPQTPPYVLMLIRPDGIETYYAAQAALKGMEFGYELIDPEWVLDFSEESGNPPWHIAAPPLATAPPSVAQGPGPEVGKIGKIGNRPVQPYRRGDLPGPVVPPVGGFSGAGSASVAGRLPGAAASQQTSLLPGAAAGGAAERGATFPLRVGGQPTRGGQGDANPAGAARESGEDGTPFPPASAAPSAAPGIGVSAASHGNAQPGVSAGRPGSPTGQPVAPGQPGGAASSGGATSGGTLPGGAAPAGNVRGVAVPGAASAGGSQDGAEPSPGARRSLPPVGPQPKPERPPTSALDRLIGNRDLVIVVDCLRDTVIVHPSGRTFAVASLSERPDPSHELVRTVQAIVSRRQATLSPGEPPYRPLLHFQIRPDGLGTYYRAYPLLEPLRLPMTRESVE